VGSGAGAALELAAAALEPAAALELAAALALELAAAAALELAAASAAAGAVPVSCFGDTAAPSTASASTPAGMANRFFLNHGRLWGVGNHPPGWAPGCQEPCGVS
jgi:hypothetical protein